MAATPLREAGATSKSRFNDLLELLKREHQHEVAELRSELSALKGDLVGRNDFGMDDHLDRVLYGMDDYFDGEPMNQIGDCLSGPRSPHTDVKALLKEQRKHKRRQSASKRHADVILEAPTDCPPKLAVDPSIRKQTTDCTPQSDDVDAEVTDVVEDGRRDVHLSVNELHSESTIEPLGLPGMPTLPADYCLSPGRDGIRHSRREAKDCRSLLALGSTSQEVTASHFEEDACLLHVTLSSAYGLRRADWLPGSASDPYCVVEVDGKPSSKRSTRYIEKTLRPVWNHHMVISEYTRGGALTFEVFDKDWGNSDDLLGYVTLDGADFEDGGFSGELKLEDTGGYQSYVKVQVETALPRKATSMYKPLKEWTEAKELTRTPTMSSRKPKSGRNLLSRQDSSVSVMSNDKKCSWDNLAPLFRTMEPTSSSRMCWDVMAVFVLGVELLWIPLSVFEPPTTIASQTLAWTTLMYWTMDIFLTFNTSFYSSRGRMIRSRTQIALKYCKSWFIFDVLLVSIDWVGVFQKAGIGGSGSDAQDDGAGAARAAKVGRIMRIARLLRLMRLAKLRQVTMIIESLIDSEAVMVFFSVGKNICSILTLNHFLACLWFGIGSQDGGWVIREQQGLLSDASFGLQYIMSMQWSLSQFTPGSPPLHAETAAERTYHVSVLALGMVVATVFVSSITSAMGAAWAAKRYNNTQSFLLKKYLSQQSVSMDLTARATRYIECVMELRNKKIPASKCGYLQMLSLPLSTQLAAEINVPFLVGYSFFETLIEISKSSVNSLCTSALSTIDFAKTDTVFARPMESKFMCFIASGQLIYRCGCAGSLKNKVFKLEKGKWYCEASLWMRWLHIGRMKALQEVTIIAVSPTKLIEVVSMDYGAFEHAREAAADFSRQAQAQKAFNLGPADIPLDMMMGKGLFVGDEMPCDEDTTITKSMMKEAEGENSEFKYFSESESESEVEDEDELLG